MSATSTSALTGNAHPTVLVLMATFNGAPWIGEQVKSIAAQTDVQVKLAICDDNSSDDTVALAVAAAGDSLPIGVIEPKEPGGSASANFFRLMRHAPLAGQQFVALADQDDIWAPGKLRAAIDRLQRLGAAGYSAAVEAFWPNGRSAVLAQCARTTLADYVFEGAGQGCSFVVTSQFFMRFQRALHLNAALFQRLHYHDWAIYAVCRANGGNWTFDPAPCLRYRQHADNDTGARHGYAAAQKRLALIRGGWYASQIDAIARLCIAIGDPANVEGAVRYLERAARAGSWRGRLSMASFILRHGRRRRTDRLVLLLTALAGHAAPTPVKDLPVRF